MRLQKKLLQRIFVFSLLTVATMQEGNASNFINRQMGNVAGGASKIPANISAVCNSASTKITAKQVSATAWFCLQTEASVKENQLFADQWKGANCTKYSATNIPKLVAVGPEPAAPAFEFAADAPPYEGAPAVTTMWAVKKPAAADNVAEYYATYNPICKAIAERLAFLKNERECDLCKYKNDVNAKGSAGGTVPAECETTVACKSIAAPPAYAGPTPPAAEAPPA